MGILAKAMESGKNLDSTAEEPSGVEETACMESVVRNWRDPPLHGNRKEKAYKLNGEIAILQERSQRGS